MMELGSISQLVLTTVTLFHISVNSMTTNSVNYWCLRDRGPRGVKMSMQIYTNQTNSAITKIEAINQDTNAVIAGCTTTNEITGAGIFTNPYTLTITVADAATGATDKNCGHKVAGNMEYTWVFKITSGSPISLPGLNFGTSGNEHLICKFDPVINPTISKDSNVDNVPQVPDRINVTPGSEQVQLYVANPSTNAKLLTFSFAQEAILVLNLIQQSDSRVGALTAIDCVACPTSTCNSDTVVLIDSQGCETNSGIFSSSATDGFTSRRNPATNVGAKTVYSNRFRMFKFSTGTLVYFKCSVDFCLTYDMATGNQQCDTRCQWSKNSRRKRSAETKRTISTVIRVVSNHGNPKSYNKSTSDEINARSCLKDPVVLITVPTIAGTALVSCIAAFSMCAVLRRAGRFTKHNSVN